MIPLDEKLQWENVKKAIQIDLARFRHNQAY